MDDDNIIVLTDDDGNEHEFELVEVMTLNGNNYAVLVPDGNDDEVTEGVVLRIEEEDGEDVLVEIDDDEEYQRVAEAWAELVEEEDDE